MGFQGGDNRQRGEEVLIPGLRNRVPGDALTAPPPLPISGEQLLPSPVRRKPPYLSAAAEAKCPPGSPHGLLEGFIRANDPRHHAGANPEAVE